MPPALTLNIAATQVGTRALGPGWRSVVWVQGCPFRCRGCVSPEWIPQRPARAVSAEDLAAELLADHEVTGLTFSGGEPMLQAAALSEVARAARRERDVSLICFTGYRLARLRAHPPSPGVPSLLAEVDVLIDGTYVEARNDGRGLRGSGNQQVHHLTERLAFAAEALRTGPRRVEVAIDGGEALLVGVPSRPVLAAFDAAVDRVRAREECAA